MQRASVVLGVIGLLLFVLNAARGQAQSPAGRRTFEVASIRANESGRPTGAQSNPLAYLPGGRFTATNVTLVDLIVRVYPTRRIQMQGGPDWIDSERFDIVAEADAAEGEVETEQWAPMVQALLEDRFKLAFHRETKETTVFALVGKVPATFREAKEEEQATFVPGNRGQMTFQHMPIEALVNTLANILHTPVVDGTGITGFFDFTLDPMQFAASGGTGKFAPNGGTDGTPPPVAESYADLVLTAVREQFGFKLEKRKAPLDIMVIDRADRPGDN
jgi:uncharacterized protein (TIGR03435 family)